MKIQVYTTPRCPYCDRAKDFLNRKGVAFEEIDVSDPDERIALVKKSGGRQTVPQIFINDKGIGGFDDMYQLDQKGELDPLLEK